MKVTVIPIVICALDTVAKRLVQGTGGFENKKRGDRPNYSIIKIGHNTEKSLGDLKRIAFTQTPVRNHWLTLVGKNFHIIIII